MALQFGNSINLNNHQILNFVVHSSGTAPTAPIEGMMWHNTTASALQLFNGGTWRRIVEGQLATTVGNVPTWDSINGNRLGTGLTVATVLGNPEHDLSIPTEKAVRDAISAAVVGGMTFRGGYDAVTNTPNLDMTAPIATSVGNTFVVTAAGLFFNVNVQAGDMLIARGSSNLLVSDWVIVNRNVQETFLELIDTPASYAGNQLRLLRVNAAQTGIEFSALPALSTTANSGMTTFTYDGTAAANIGLNFQNLALETVHEAADIFAFHDVSATAMRRGTLGSLRTHILAGTPTGSIKNLLLSGDGGFTWGQIAIATNIDDSLHLVAGAGIEIQSDPTLKAVRIRNTVSATLAYSNITDGINTATAATTSDTLRLMSFNEYLSIAVQNNHATLGDNVLFTLSSLVAATDRINNFTAQNNFLTGLLRIANPAGTFHYTFATSAIIASRTITLPLLGGNDTFVFETHPAILSGKTINIADNPITGATNAAGDLMRNNGTRFVTFARGAANQVLRVNSAGTDIEWAAPAIPPNMARVMAGTPSGTSVDTLFFDHNLNSQNVVAVVTRISDNTVVWCNVVATTANRVNLIFGSPQTGTNFRVIVIG